MPGNPSGSGGGAEDWDFGDEEKEQIVEEILNALDAAGHDSETESDEEKEAREGKIRDEINKFRERQKNKKGQEPDDKKKKSGHDALKDLANELAQKDKASSERGLSGKHGVREESVRHWKEIKSKYQPEITAMASDFAEVFLDDRRKRLEYLKREGEIIPGLEYETIAALLSGELDPDTRMKSVQNPDFLETEVEFIIDTSGSMGGEKIKSSVELMVMTVEAFKQVRELLSDEDLLIEGEEPLRVGVTAFSTLPERITPLTEPLSDQKELKIVDKSSEVGGGTDEADTIRQTYEQLAVGRDNVLKIITVLSDGYGNREGVAPIMQQVEKDDRVIFLAVGFGNTDEEASAVTATYLDPISDHGKNIHAITVTDPKESVPKVVEFLRREVARHRL